MNIIGIIQLKKEIKKIILLSKKRKENQVFPNNGNLIKIENNININQIIIIMKKRKII